MNYFLMIHFIYINRNVFLAKKARKFPKNLKQSSVPIYRDVCRVKQTMIIADFTKKLRFSPLVQMKNTE